MRSIGVDSGQLQTCVRNHQADAQISRDTELAKQLNITATPTLFVNGQRVISIRSEDDLRNLVSAASKLDKTGVTR
jgi:protein-disulfide isomerase